MSIVPVVVWVPTTYFEDKLGVRKRSRNDVLSHVSGRHSSKASNVTNGSIANSRGTLLTLGWTLVSYITSDSIFLISHNFVSSES